MSKYVYVYRKTLGIPKLVEAWPIAVVGEPNEAQMVKLELDAGNGATIRVSAAVTESLTPSIGDYFARDLGNGHEFLVSAADFAEYASVYGGQQRQDGPPETTEPDAEELKSNLEAKLLQAEQQTAEPEEPYKEELSSGDSQSPDEELQ